jgi:hypothetical protein
LPGKLRLRNNSKLRRRKKPSKLLPKLRASLRSRRKIWNTSKKLLQDLELKA